jgi:hypothetical protein
MIETPIHSLPAFIDSIRSYSDRPGWSAFCMDIGSRATAMESVKELKKKEVLQITRELLKKADELGLSQVATQASFGLGKKEFLAGAMCGDTDFKEDHFMNHGKKKCTPTECTGVLSEIYGNALIKMYQFHNSGSGKQSELRYAEIEGDHLWRSEGVQLISNFVQSKYSTVQISDRGVKPQLSSLINETVVWIKGNTMLSEWNGFRERPQTILFADGLMCFSDSRCYEGEIDFSTLKTRPYEIEDHVAADQVLPLFWEHPDGLQEDACDGLYSRIIKNYELPQDKEASLYQIIGLAFLNHYVMQKFFLLTGDGDNGKTAFTCMLNRLLGGNSCSVIPQALNHESFSASNLCGKLANIADDFSSEEIKNLSTIKQLSGNSLQTAKRKYRADIEFKNYATLIFTCNTVPLVTCDDDAVWRRAWPLELKKQFKKGSVDRIENLDEKIEAVKYDSPDLLYVVGKAIRAAFLICVENDNLKWNPGTIETKRIWDELSNPLNLFLPNFTEPTTMGGEPVSEFLDYFNLWYAHKNGNKLINRLGYTQVKKYMTLLGYTQERCRYSEGLSVGVGVTYWHGLIIKPDAKIYLDRLK